MAVRTKCFGFLLLSVSLAGCGTVANLVKPGTEEGAKSPFGGVKADVSSITRATGNDPDSKPHPEAEYYPRFAFMLFCAADLPFSLMGDLLTWPYTVAYTRVNEPVPAPPITVAPAQVQVQLQPLPQDPPAEPLGKPTKLP